MHRVFLYGWVGLLSYLADLSISSRSLIDVSHEEVILLLVENASEVGATSEALNTTILLFTIVLQEQIAVTTVFSPASRTIL